MNENEVRSLLVKHIIDKSKSEWKIKKPNSDGIKVEIPDGLNGEILLEEDIRDGKIRGWTTITVENLASILTARDDPSKRPDGVIPDKPNIPAQCRGKTFREITSAEYEECGGHKGSLDKWRAEGIAI